VTSHYCSDSVLFFQNLQFIFLFLNIWTLTFYCFRLKNVLSRFWDIRVSNRCWAFSSLFWLVKLTSNHSATVTTLLYSIISILLWLLIVYFAIQNINNLFKKAIHKTRYKYFRADTIYVQNWRVCALLKCILAMQKQLTNRPQVQK
jgi:uncharacterized protein with PQ loop repeat